MAALLTAGRLVAVAVSGGGRTLANLLQRQQSGSGYQVAAVIASNAECAAVAIAKAHQLPLFVGDFSAAGHAACGERLYPWLCNQRINWVALAGFIKLFPLHSAWSQRIVNIHPSLLPKHGGKGMYGDKVHAAVLAAGDVKAGASVHFVTPGYDEGAVVAQVSVPVQPGDTVRLLADRVFAAESQLYPETLNLLISGVLPRADGVVERSIYDGT